MSALLSPAWLGAPGTRACVSTARRRAVAASMHATAARDDGCACARAWHSRQYYSRVERRARLFIPFCEITCTDRARKCSAYRRWKWTNARIAIQPGACTRLESSALPRASAASMLLGSSASRRTDARAHLAIHVMTLHTLLVRILPRCVDPPSPEWVDQDRERAFRELGLIGQCVAGWCEAIQRAMFLRPILRAFAGEEAHTVV